ncbi:MAG: NADPH-dependent F420 reductase [Litorilinea sp.]
MNRPTIAVIGGTGAEGSGLALRWAAAGYPVIIGSRSAEKATDAARELVSLIPAERAPAEGVILTGADNATAAAQAEIVVLSVPYSAQAGTIDQIAGACGGKIVATVNVPLKLPKVSVVWRPDAGSAAQEAQRQLGEDVQVVAAFQNISAEPLRDLDWSPDCDVLVVGDAKAAKSAVMELAQAAGFFAVDAGPLANASVVEGMTALLIGINIRNKIKHAGIRITGLARA